MAYRLGWVLYWACLVLVGMCGVALALSEHWVCSIPHKLEPSHIGSL
jgi:hypothetical protein